ncbi:enhancer of edr1 3, glucan synthase-like 5, GLUCAN SYNTHASE-LIKE 5, POWDERY MILDEW RESISTANT 4 [Hibiscus trionum]|uniref:1,3-beta-glucan synthase n=1 Tax=Hibiscus trionum TaxID=183268 RepID=A0A9W7IXU4_HIBTR|nr:enhancer of edr1 3, glucan synthase-like 5, GLUCAN SYNTHASE-LIKE 5, POWDERY MILDEW RESISTANT 4 [Hibiscus trionum]
MSRPRFRPDSGSSPPDDELYNIIPTDNLHTDHPCLQYPQVRIIISSLQDVGNLRTPPFHPWLPSMDLLHWLGLFFGFQSDNVKNQREHLVLHLANAHMSLSHPPDTNGSFQNIVLREFRSKLLENYTNWCSYLGAESNVRIPDSSGFGSDITRRELLYVGLYLLIWGESANLRFMPECICYIFHHMAMELNKILEDCTDENTGEPWIPSISGENAFLNRVVKPIYDTINVEVMRSKNGTTSHDKWRNYDDFNEYFWSKECFHNLKWPLDFDNDFTSGRKTGFVEQRTFWNVFRSFDRLWVMLFVSLHLMCILAREEKKLPWQALNDKDDKIRVLSLFITWSGMRFLHALLEAAMEFSRLSREMPGLVLRMVLKISVAAAWTCGFLICYTRIWVQRDHDRHWSGEANERVTTFLRLAFVYGLPELVKLVLFFLPCIRMNCKAFYPVSWWFHGDCFIGRGMKEGVVDSIKYILFWVVVLATKFTFSYFFQIKPMISTTKQLLDSTNAEYEWGGNAIFSVSNKFIIGLLWLPVLLIYMADTQIWYSIYSPFVGAVMGLLQQLGEIRNIEQLSLRFRFFATAIQFNLMPQEETKISCPTLREQFSEAIHRLKVRCGLRKPLEMVELESNQVDANKFVLIWNEIITTFREEDIISDHEVELLQLSQHSWLIRVIRWPCFLLGNELLRALVLATDFVDAPDNWLWHKICKNEYTRCAVIETYDSVKYLMLHVLIKRNTEEHSILQTIFSEIDLSIGIGKFTMTFRTAALLQVHSKLLKLVELLLEPNKNVNEIVNVMQALYEIVVRRLFRVKRTIRQLLELGLAKNPTATGGYLFENVVDFPDHGNNNFYTQVKRLHSILTTKDSMQTIPANNEARRRLAFFSNSLFMKMPPAPQVEKMIAFSVLTPFNDEDVLYSKEALETKNEDGISILYYLQTIYDDEWKNFIQRMRLEGMETADEIWTTKLRDLRLWASYRGQTLARTVRGMMYYYRALKLLAFLDSSSETNTTVTEKEGIALMKYTFVVSCQKYWEHKAERNPRAEEIMDLLKHNEALRVSYIDQVSTGIDDNDEKEYYSVLIKYDRKLEREVEIYRIKLPGPIKLGEGKPENQNHGFVYTRGDAVQTIDMNQDNNFEEALKIRNLLEEFRHHHGIRRPTILGVREHIFTGSVSSVAWFMSAQETSFVTLLQRLFANLLKIRMHYGHPDVFDRLWFMTRGGLSKASKVINISEDIFAGFNCTLRGGSVTHHEYIQVGKGRDLGLNQISTFETKIACGNGEQILSRDVYRLSQRLDFFKMLSFFYTTIGYFFNTTVIILSVYVFLWGQLYLALSGVENSVLGNDNNSKKAVSAVINQELIIQFGLFATLPAILESSIEIGFLEAIWEFLVMQLQLSTVFYIFSTGTRAHFFGRTILHGGAKYRQTGRNFVVQHTSFAENYRLYARSHFIKAIEFGLILTVYAMYTPSAKVTFFYIDMAVTCWLLVLSWIFAPFLFNPSGFDWLKTVNDFDDFMNWIWYRGGVFAKAEQSWESWWYEEQDHLLTTSLWGKLLEIILNLRFFFFQYGIVYHLRIAGQSRSISVYLLSWIFIFVAFGVYLTLVYVRDKYRAKEHIYFVRMADYLLMILGILVIVLLRAFTAFKYVDIFTSLLLFIPTGWGLISIAQVFRPLLRHTRLWDSVVCVARLYDILFGVIVMAPVAVLSWLPGFQLMQTRILFNDAFSKGLQMFKIITEKVHQKDA